MKKISIAILAALGLALFGGAPASAQTVVSVPVDGIIYGTPGQTYEFASGDVPTEFIGWTCAAAAATDNNGSVHPNNNLIVTTGGTTVIIPDVESDPGIVHQVEGSITLGATINVSVTLGSHGVTSGGFVISFTCSEPAPPTTVPATTVPTSPPTTCPAGSTPGTDSDGNESCETSCPEGQTPGTDSDGNDSCVLECPEGQTPGKDSDGNDSCVLECPEGQTPGKDSDGNDVCTTDPLGPTTTAPAPLAPTTIPDPAGPSATLPVTGTSTTYLVASGGVALLSLGVALLAVTQILGSSLVAKRD